MQHQMDFVDVVDSTVAARRVHVDADKVETIGERVSHAIGEVADRLQHAQVNPLGPPLASYRISDDGFDVVVGFRVDAATGPVQGLELVTLAGGVTAHTTHLGPYDELPSAYEDLQKQVADCGRSVDHRGPMWEEYWSDPETPADQTRTEIFWPVTSSPNG